MGPEESSKYIRELGNSNGAEIQRVIVEFRPQMQKLLGKEDSEELLKAWIVAQLETVGSRCLENDMIHEQLGVELPIERIGEINAETEAEAQKSVFTDIEAVQTECLNADRNGQTIRQWLEAAGL